MNFNKYTLVFITVILLMVTCSCGAPATLPPDQQQLSSTDSSVTPIIISVDKTSTSEPPDVITEIEPHLLPSETIWPTPTAHSIRPSPFPDPNKSRYFKFDLNKLALLHASQQYILYSEDEDIHALSMDGSLDVKLGTGEGIVQSMTYDGKVIGTSGNDTDLWEFFDFETNKFEIKSVLSPKSLSGECRLGNVSPNREWATILCVDEEEHLYLENLEDHRVITVPENSSLFYSWSWSPDGKWLIYFENNVNLFPGQFGNGSGEVILVDVSCLENNDTCPLTTTGPYALKDEPIWGMGSLAWSPDGRYFGFPSGMNVLPIQTFDSVEKRFSTLNIGNNDHGVYGLAWSPDGKWVAVSSGSDINVVSSSGGEPVMYEKGDRERIVFGWLSTFPSPEFKLGNTLIISGAGDNLNVRSEPSIKSEIVDKLHTDDQLQIIDGPVEADHYTWWKVRMLRDQTEGWAVEHSEWYVSP